MNDRTDIALSGEMLDLLHCINFVQDDGAGGLDVFIGTVRNNTRGKEVRVLTFEAYDSMALSEMGKIAARALEQWPVIKLAIHHRTGELTIGEMAVVIAVSAAHRDAAFEACRFCIDELKKTVPIWKKERFDDGEVWVAAHP